MWGDVGRCGEMRGDAGRCGEISESPRESGTERVKGGLAEERDGGERRRVLAAQRRVAHQHAWRRVLCRLLEHAGRVAEDQT